MRNDTVSLCGYRTLLLCAVAALSLAHLAAAVSLNTSMPRFDDWVLVQSFLLWKQGDLGQLLQPFNIHPTPLAKLLLFTIWDIFGIDLRPVAFVSALTLVVSVVAVLWFTQWKIPSTIRSSMVILQLAFPWSYWD